MDTMRQRNLTIAKVFLFGQLLAFGVFALLTAADALAAGKVGYALPPILVFGIATSAVVYFRLASRLSEGLSVRRLSVVALGISLLGLILAFRHFRLLTDLGGSMATSSGLGRLSTTATLALVAFGLAFLAVLATVVFVRGPSEG